MTAALVHHKWHEVLDGETRYCCTPLAKGGCGAMQVREPRSFHGMAWFPPVGRTCTTQRAFMAARGPP